MTGINFSERLEYVGVAAVEPGYHVWGSSPVLGPDGRIHLFVARWPVSATFDPGWRRASEVARYTSDQPEGPFAFQEVVVTGAGASSWDSCAPHNPTVQAYQDKYILLYIANDGETHRSSQKIGMMIASDPKGPWRRAGEDGLILAPPEDGAVWCHGSCVGVNNPAWLVHPDGRFFLYFKAKREGDVHRMGVAISEHLEGPYVIEKDPVSKNEQMIEDGYAFVEDGRIHLLTTDCQKGTGILWSSDDGLAFDPPTPGFETIDNVLPAGTLESATNHRGRNFERPQILLRENRPSYLYVASGVNVLGGDGSCSYVFRIRR